MTITHANPINMGAPMASINVPAIKYKSGNRIWYATTIPYKVLGKFIHTSSSKKKNRQYIKSEIRNRFLDVKHKNEIKDYILQEQEYTIPPVTLVSYEQLDFRPYTFGNQKSPTIEEQQEMLDSVGSIAGVIVLPIDYEFECLDGNHRTVAIRELANEHPEAIADSSMLLNIVYENRPRKIRQDFVDVNKNAKQTSSSINTLFNTRDKVSGIVVDIIEGIDYLKDTTELLATSVSKNSKDIYTINNIKNAIVELGGFNSQSTKSEKISERLVENPNQETILRKRAETFFNELKSNRWVSECLQHRDETPEIRNKSLITSGTGIIIASRVAGHIFENFIEGEVLIEIRRLLQLDWSRSNPIFNGTVVVSGNKISNSREAISTAVAAVKKNLGYKLTESEYKYLG